jgi:hypothetical protein
MFRDKFFYSRNYVKFRRTTVFALTAVYNTRNFHTKHCYLTLWTFVFLVSGRIEETQTNINAGSPLSNKDFNRRSSEEQNGINHNDGTFDVKSESMPLAQQRRNAFCHI